MPCAAARVMLRETKRSTTAGMRSAPRWRDVELVVVQHALAGNPRQLNNNAAANTVLFLPPVQ